MGGSGIARILVPVDFSPASDAALDYALATAEACGADVELLHVWRPRALFADTPEGEKMARALTAAESLGPARVSGRLEVGEEPSQVILSILERERFDLVVLGRAARLASLVTRTAPCRVVAFRAA